MDARIDSSFATLVGFGAIITWSLLTLIVSFTGAVPPFQLVAMSFTIAFFVGLIAAIIQGKDLIALMKMPLGVWALGVTGLFGYHFLFFMALRNAPLLEASLINYVWPLLIVLFSTLLPKKHLGGKLGWWHIAGAMLGLFGVVLIVSSGAPSSGTNTSWFGYVAAAAAAFVWATYSVLSRLISFITTHAITLFCGLTAIGATLAHLAFETSVMPSGTGQWMAILALGLGPVGGAFYLWDFGMKHGDIRILGAGAYLTPLFTALILTVAGISQPNTQLWLASIAITGGAVLAARDILFRRKQQAGRKAQL